MDKLCSKKKKKTFDDFFPFIESREKMEKIFFLCLLLDAKFHWNSFSHLTEWKEKKILEFPNNMCNKQMKKNLLTSTINIIIIICIYDIFALVGWVVFFFFELKNWERIEHATFIFFRQDENKELMVVVNSLKFLTMMMMMMIRFRDERFQK